MYKHEYHKGREEYEYYRVKYDDPKEIIRFTDNDPNYPDDPYSTEYSDEEMYSKKLTGWYRTQKELRALWKEKLRKEDNPALKQQAIAELDKLNRQMKKTGRLEQIRAELMSAHEAKKVTYNNFIEETGEEPLVRRDISPVPDAVENIMYLKDSQSYDSGNINSELQEFAADFQADLDEKVHLKKFDWWKQMKASRNQHISLKIKREIEEIQAEENGMEERIEYMFNNLHSINDRRRVRNILAHEMHKKASVKDIADMLDDMILDYKVLHGTDINLNPQALNKTYKSEDLYMTLKKVANKGKILPNFYEDRDLIKYLAHPDVEYIYRKVVNEVDQDDLNRDHSIKTLSDHENLELQIFSAIKKDPYYKHYIYNCLRYESEYMNAKLNDLSLAIAADNYKMRIKFDPIKIPLMDAKKEAQDFVGRLYNGKAWGAGRRKSARAIACVQPGSGKITVNGRKFHDYFLLPTQRHTVVKPLKISSYTAILDVDIWVKGGGQTGQPGAIVPALSKALCRFDPGLRDYMKANRLINDKIEGHFMLYSDGRVRERKHYGKKRARKGRVYRRR